VHILLIRLHLQIPQAHSLKDKRRQIKSLKERLMNRFNASVAEVDFLDNWQKSELAVCMLSNDKSYLEELQLMSMRREWL